MLFIAVEFIAVEFIAVEFMPIIELAPARLRIIIAGVRDRIIIPEFILGVIACGIGRIIMDGITTGRM
jgi:hypothetical protein